MDVGILANPVIPLLCIVIAIIIYLSQYVTLKSNKKIVLEKRTKNKSSAIQNKIYTGLLKRLEKYTWYNDIVSKIQFNMGYFSSDSERKNRVRAEKFVINNIIKIIIESLVVIIIFKTTILIKVFCIVLLNLLKIFLYRNNIAVKKNRLINEFPMLVKEFITNYVDRLSVTEAFQMATPNVSPVYQVHLNRLVSQLHSGKGVEESLINFDDRIDYVMCSSFISIVKSAFSTNRNVITNLLELETLIAQERANSKKFKDKLQEKKSNIYFLIFCIVMEIVFVGSYAASNTGNFFITTLEGQALLLASIISFAMAILTIIYVELL